MHYSVERYFSVLRHAMPADISVRTRVVPVYSRATIRRLAIIADVARQRGHVVHVTGDIHFAALGVLGRRAVLTVLDCGIADSAPSAKAAIFRSLWLQWPARRAARVVAISSFTADQLSRYTGIGRDEIDVIPVAIDDHYAPAPKPPEGVRPVVLCFATTPNKNIDRIVDALQDLDVHLHVIGPLGTGTRNALEASGLAFTNSVDLSDEEMRARYAECDVVLFPSTYEGFGMPIVEAQAVGRPVVTSDRAPMNEVSGGAACLVNPEDVASIRAGLQRVLGDAAYGDELVRKGLENRERFRPAAAAEAYAAIYREVAEATKRKR